MLADVNGPTIVPKLAVPTDPVQPSVPRPPLALHEVALLEPHDSETVFPACTDAGVATRFVTVAAGVDAEVTVKLTD